MKTPVPESFNKDAGLRPHAEANVIEKDAGVFLWILRDFSFFRGTTPRDRFRYFTFLFVNFFII